MIAKPGLLRRPVGPSAAIVAAYVIAGAGDAARADDTGQPANGSTFTVTETSVFNYHFDNRNNIHTDDHYGEWINRLNLQAADPDGHFTAAVRIDSAAYFRKPDPNALARSDAGPGASAAVLQNQTARYGVDLSNRYVSGVYPAKLELNYSGEGVDVTVGDAYVQLGRGFVLSLRKIDELAIDTTIRGGRVNYKGDFGDMRLNATAVAGLANPLRVDDVSGRQFTQQSGGLRGAFFPLAPRPHGTSYVPDPHATYSPDLIAGGRVEAGTRHLLVGVQGSMIDRGQVEFLRTETLPAYASRRMSVASVSVSAPAIAEHGSVYFEAATQGLTASEAAAGDPRQRELLSRLSGGYALYGLGSYYAGPVTVTFEGKHYERFFPLAASSSSSGVEFRTLQYNVVPTTEPITSDTQFHDYNTCVTGGRVRVDYRASDHAVVYGSLGRYATYGERSATCGQSTRTDTQGNLVAPTGRDGTIRNDVWDPLLGLELQFEEARTHAFAWSGVRFDDSADAEIYPGVAGSTRVYYREHYARYDMVKKIAGPWSVQAVGVHRYRYQPELRSTPWREGENYLSLIYSPKVTAAVGYEYSTLEGSRKDFFNGLFQYRITTASAIRAFVGQTRPALRCVSGVCRQFPAFEGAKVELVVRL